MKKRKKRSNKNTLVKQKNTFTKLWMNRLLWFCCIWITCSYLLASRGFVEIAETLSQTACATIIGTMIPYLLKSFFETREEKKNEIDQMKIHFHSNNDPLKSPEIKGFEQSKNNFNDTDVNNDIVG